VIHYLTILMNPKRLKTIGSILNVLNKLAPILVARTIFYFFSKPLNKAGFTPKRIDFLIKSNKQIKSLENHQIAYYRWKGAGPTVLLLHGWESNSGRWKSLVKRLQEANFNVIAFDAPAHGFSNGKHVTPVLFAKIADHFIHEFNVKHLVGHSFGGYTSIHYAEKYQHELDSVIALAPTNSIRDVVNGMQKALGLNKHTILSFDKVFTKHYGASPDSFDASHAAKSISVKGLIIHDLNDNILPISGSYAIRNSWKNAEFMQSEGLGHRLIHKRIDDKIVQFIKIFSV